MLRITFKLKTTPRLNRNPFMDQFLYLTLLFVPLVSSINHIPPIPAFTNYGHHSSSGRANSGNYLSGLGSEGETYFTGLGEPEEGLAGSGGLSTCLSNYEISEGSIIRTKDSQELGAKFLNESDLGAAGHDECLKLCCRTPRCNVAVFQEKNSGSCYMFDCGSTEDFRCKFTSEISYMSAILRRREVQVAPQQASHTNSQQQHSTSNNQHEAELNQLRRTQAGEIVEIKESQRSGGVGGGSGGGSGSATSLSKSSTSTSTPNPLTALESNSRRCSRWQFECKSSGECIAIYNACDGIPNCEDGSDESPELHCPSVIGANPVVPQWKPQPPANPQQEQQPKNSGVEKASGSPGISHQTQQNSPVYQSQQGGHQQIYPVGNEPPMPQKNDHIFNHKNAGVMDPSYGNQLQQQKQHDSANNPFWKQQPYDYNAGGEQLSNSAYGAGSNYPGQQQSSRVYGNNGVGNSPSFQSEGSTYPYQSNNSPYQNQQGLLQPFQPPQGGQYVPTNNAGQGKIQPVFIPGGGSQIGQPGNSGHSKDPSPNSVQPPKVIVQGGLPSAADVSNGNPPPASSGGEPVAVSSSTSAPKVPKEPAVQVPVPANGKSPGKVDPEAKLEDEILASLKSQPYSSQSVDVQMEEMSPHRAGPGAFILLILGVVMSIVMAIVIGCRLRRIGLGHGRRRRKNRLDSDYLVDGMYL